MMRNRAALVLCFLVFLGLGYSHASIPIPRQSDAQEIHVRNFEIPGYPPLARQACIQDTVSAKVTIGRDGSVESVSEPNGHPLFKFAVQSALKNWVFDLAPGEEKKELVVSFRFSLRGKATDGYAITQVSGTLPNAVEVSTQPYPRRLEGDVITGCPN